MTAQTRQVWLLGVLLAALGGIVTYQFSGSGTAGSGAQPSNPREAQTRAPERMEVADVNLDQLQPGNDPFTTPRRDPFDFRPKPAPPAPPPPPRPSGPTVFVPPAPTGPPPPRPIALKYIGFAMHANGVRIALLSDGNVRAPFEGVQGDVIDGQYRLLRVDANEVEMSYLDGTGRRRIPKTGQ